LAYPKFNQISKKDMSRTQIPLDQLALIKRKETRQDSLSFNAEGKGNGNNYRVKKADIGEFFEGLEVPNAVEEDAARENLYSHFDQIMLQNIIESAAQVGITDLSQALQIVLFAKQNGGVSNSGVSNNVRQEGDLSLDELCKKMGIDPNDAKRFSAKYQKLNREAGIFTGREKLIEGKENLGSRLANVPESVVGLLEVEISKTFVMGLAIGDLQPTAPQSQPEKNEQEASQVDYAVPLLQVKDSSQTTDRNDRSEASLINEEPQIVAQSQEDSPEAIEEVQKEVAKTEDQAEGAVVSHKSNSSKTPLTDLFKAALRFDAKFLRFDAKLSPEITPNSSEPTQEDVDLPNTATSRADDELRSVKSAKRSQKVRYSSVVPREDLPYDQLSARTPDEPRSQPTNNRLRLFEDVSSQLQVSLPKSHPFGNLRPRISKSSSGYTQIVPEASAELDSSPPDLFKDRARSKKVSPSDLSPSDHIFSESNQSESSPSQNKRYRIFPAPENKDSPNATESRVDDESKSVESKKRSQKSRISPEPEVVPLQTQSQPQLQPTKSGSKLFGTVLPTLQASFQSQFHFPRFYAKLSPETDRNSSNFTQEDEDSFNTTITDDESRSVKSEKRPEEVRISKVAPEGDLFDYQLNTPTRAKPKTQSENDRSKVSRGDLFEALPRLQVSLARVLKKNSRSRISNASSKTSPADQALSFEVRQKPSSSLVKSSSPNKVATSEAFSAPQEDSPKTVSSSANAQLTRVKKTSSNQKTKNTTVTPTTSEKSFELLDAQPSANQQPNTRIMSKFFKALKTSPELHNNPKRKAGNISFRPNSRAVHVL
jgi:hypothetical protein